MLKEGDRVKDLRYPEFNGTVDEVWRSGPQAMTPDKAVVVWDETGCSSEVDISDLVKVTDA